MKILHLPMKLYWFNMVKSGEKPWEYREIKPHWISRLCVDHKGILGDEFMDKHKVISYTFKQFDIVRMTAGYQKNAPTMDIEFERIEIVKPISGLCEEGWLDTDVFGIKLGRILNGL